MISTADETPPPQLTSSSLREDCWSPDETFALIDSWGSHYLSLNRGKLTHQHWLAVADAVNSTETTLLRRRRTDSQCKNRMDTLKKRYKLEKAKSNSPWPFFSRLNFLISGGNNSPSPAPPTKTPDRVPVVPSRFPVGRRSAIPKRPARWLLADEEVVEREAPEGSSSIGGAKKVEMRRRAEDEEEEREKEEGEEFEMGCRELAAAVRKIGEVYERVEGRKQKQWMELEKERMKFVKEMESERLNLMIQTQLQLSRIKRSKPLSSSS